MLNGVSASYSHKLKTLIRKNPDLALQTLNEVAAAGQAVLARSAERAVLICGSGVSSGKWTTWKHGGDQTLSPGKHTITFDFHYDGGGIGKGGTGSLDVDGKKVAEGKFPRTVAYRFSLDETFDVGEDTGTLVVEDYADKMPFKFTGKIEKVTIDLK